MMANHLKQMEIAMFTNTSDVQPIALRINDAARYVGISRSTLYKLASTKRLAIRKVAGRAVVLRADLDRLVLSNSNI
jgi:excisionase family DNA binding protein